MSGSVMTMPTAERDRRRTRSRARAGGGRAGAGGGGARGAALRLRRPPGADQLLVAADGVVVLPALRRLDLVPDGVRQEGHRLRRVVPLRRGDRLPLLLLLRPVQQQG